MAKAKKPVSPEETAQEAQPVRPVRGYGTLVPEVCGMDSEQMVAYNIAKSFYVTHPEVFNLNAVSAKLNVPAKLIKARLQIMIGQQLLMLVDNPSVMVSGFGLYYWVVKLKKDTPKEARDALTEWFQENDQICTGYMMEAGGEFDYFNGNHMRNLDNLISGVLSEFRYRDCVEWVHLCPVRRLIRESHVNQFDAAKDVGRYFWGEAQLKSLLKAQNKLHEIDFKIIDALNNHEKISDMFDFQVLSKLSGLDAQKMEEGLSYAVEECKCQLPMLYFNYMALGLKMRFFLVDLFPNTYTQRAEQIVDELSEIPDWENIFDFGDSHHNLILSAYEGISDIDVLREKIRSYPEVMEIREALSPRQFRRWTSRLDSQHGYWEESVYTDDLFKDRTKADNYQNVLKTNKEGQAK